MNIKNQMIGFIVIMLTLFLLINVQVAHSESQNYIITRVDLPFLLKENEILLIRLRIIWGEAQVIIKIFHNKNLLWEYKIYLINETKIISTIKLKQGIYEINILFVGIKEYFYNLKVVPPPVDYHMRLFENGFYFKSKQNFTITIYKNNEPILIKNTKNLLYKFHDNSRYSIILMDKWGWVNSKHNFNYWWGCGDEYIWENGK